MNTRKYGDSLEDYVQYNAKRYGLTLKKSTNSGALNPTDSDLSNEWFQIECKRNSKPKPSVSIKDWEKVRRQASQRNKMPVLVNGCEDIDKSIATISLLDFIKLLTAWEHAQD